ncbi:MAG TPA: CRISPR-associated helicase Cas3' [Gammaproteobacteria bacterium]|nr:CRISPR-associated helicase Cas3' [Gammaproteobacteria bacterium]
MNQWGKNNDAGETPAPVGGQAIAHVRLGADGEWIPHPLIEHLRQVAALAGRFAAAFDGERWAELAGRWHDLGKFSADFQSYIRNASGFERGQAHIEDEHVPGRVDHSTAGAIHAVKTLGVSGRLLAYLIAGHHAGLPDWEKLEGGTGGALRERLRKTDWLDRALAADVPDETLRAECPRLEVPGGRAGFAFWLRMLFSCLVDADFLDTEAFMDGDRAEQRGAWPALAELRGRFDAHMAALIRSAAETPVNRLRQAILRQCREKAAHSPGIFSLTVPTGGGKTLSGMAFALDHAIAHGKRRVIHVIPYTSIIEQTADIFRGIFGDAVIEHHSSLDPDRETARSRLATENWDAPIIVTTSVQFFESLFAARTSRCRKLHNLVDSVVVLDEAQLLPPEFLQPILDALNLLVAHYGVTVVLSTATQPALESRKDSFGKTLLRGLDNVEEIIDDPDALYAALERVRVRTPTAWQSGQSWEEIAGEIARHDSVLAIVNTRRQARELHALLPRETIHLSALMCGQHRSDVIADIKDRLQRGKPVRVISTQLVEAGVDLDFPVVYRALAGLDSIAQAAGRCNREGRLDRGEVVVFVPPEPAPPGTMRRAAAKAVSVLSGHAGQPLGRDRFSQFFRLFYADTDLDKRHIVKLLTPNDELGLQFRTAARRFRLIEETGESVLARYHASEGDDRIERLLSRLRRDGPSRWLMRKLQRYSVTVSEYHFRQLREDSQIEEIWPGIWAQAAGTTVYDPTLGLALETDAPAAADLVV